MPIRPAAARGRTNLGWLDSAHTFSFGRYYDPQHMGYGALRVINDDRVAPSGGFGTHPHQNMEIISYVVSGELEHKDSLGNGSIIRPGDIQLMRAGTGITHSEFNPSQTQATRFLQIWIEPQTSGLAPGYQQAYLPGSAQPDTFRLLVAPEGAGGAVSIAQDARVWGLLLHAGQDARLDLEADRALWLQVVSGSVRVTEQELSEGDGLAMDRARSLQVRAEQDADVLVFDLQPQS